MQFDPTTARPLEDNTGFDPASAQPAKPAGIIRRLADMTAVPLAQGVVGVPEALVGIADIATGGHAGRLAEQAGFRPREAKQIIGDALYSEEQQQVNRRVAEADGFVPTLEQALRNPSTIARTAVESLPSMFAGGAISRIARAARPAMSRVAAGALGEGAIMAGQQAESIRQETEDGTLSAPQAALAVATGVGGGFITRLGGQGAARAGIGDVENLLAGGAKAATSKGVPRQITEGVVREGAEELSQSVLEQVAQNLALGKPWNEGVGNAAAMGLLTGGLVGGAVAPLGSQAAAPAPSPAPAPPAAPLLLTNDQDPLLGFPDGTVAYRSEVEKYIASLPEAQRVAAMAQLLGRTQPADETQLGAAPFRAAAAPPLKPAVTPSVQSGVALDFDTLPGAAAPREGEVGYEPVLGSNPNIQGVVDTTAHRGPVNVNLEPRGPVSRAAAIVQALGGGPGGSLTGNDPATLAGITGNSAANQTLLDVARSRQPAPAAPADFTPQFPVDDHFEVVHQAATSPLSGRKPPSQAQQAAENHKVGRIRIAGMGFSVENGAGTQRSGRDMNGREWAVTMQDHYTRMPGTKAADSTPQKAAQLDAIVKLGTPADHPGPVFVIDQVNPETGKFDEHKLVVGATDEADAAAVYRRNYAADWNGLGSITRMDLPDFKKWAYDGKTKTAAVGDLALWRPADRAATAPGAAPADAAAASAPAGQPGVPAGGEPVAAVAQPQPAPGPQFYGAQGKPLAEGGKAFPSYPAANKFKRQHMPQARVLKAPDGKGFVLRDPTDKELAARAKAGKRLQSAVGQKGMPLAAHEFLAGKGGLSQKAKADAGFDRNVRIGSRWLFAGPGKGLTIERATELLIEEGHLPEGALHNQAFDLIRRSVTNPQYTPERVERIAERELEQRRARAEAEQDVAALEDAELAAFYESAYDDVPALDAPGNTTEAAAMRALGFTEQEILDALATTEPDAASQEAGGQGGAQPVEVAAGAAQGSDRSGEEAPRDADQGLGGTGVAEPEADYGNANPAGDSDLFGAAPSQGQQAIARVRAEREADERRRQQSAPDASGFTLTGSDRADDEGTARGQDSLFEPQSQYDTGYETDLFGNPVPRQQALPDAGAPRSRRAEPEQPGLRGNTQPATAVSGQPADTTAPAGEYYVETFVATPQQRQLGAARIQTPDDAARATAYLYRSAVERFDGIVTDKDGKPLAVVGGFKGAVSEAAIYPATVMGEAIRIPGAARIWFSHNHPSGTAELSRADLLLNETLTTVFRGSGIEPMGLLAVARDRFDFAPPTSGTPLFRTPVRGVIPQPMSAAERVSVPVYERELADARQAPLGIRTPTDAMAVAKTFAERANGPGMLLLDAAMQVSAWVPLDAALRGPLRNTGGLNALYRSISQSGNASNMILVHRGELDASVKPGGPSIVENIARAAFGMNVRALDSINVATNFSAAQAGLGPSGSGPFFSRSAEPLFRNDSQRAADALAKSVRGGMTRSEFSRAIDAAFGREVGRRLEQNGVVIPLEDQSELPDHVVPFVRSGDIVYGFYDPETDRTYAVLQNLSADMVRGLVLHEVGVHYGFEQMLGRPKYAKVIKRIKQLGREGNAEVKAALAQASKNSAAASEVPEETLAYLVQNHPEMGLVRTVIASIKAFLYRNFGIDNLSVDDIAARAPGAVRRASRPEPGSEARTPQFARGTTPPMASRKDVPGTNQGGAPAGDETGGDAKPYLSDEQGKPLVLHHGTSKAFDEFDVDADDGRGAGAIWFTDSHNYAYDMAGGGGWNVPPTRRNPNARVISARIRSGNPKTIDILAESRRVAEQIGEAAPEDADAAQAILAGGIGWDQVVGDWVSEAKAEGHDALILKNFGDGRMVTTTAYLVFSPEQIEALPNGESQGDRPATGDESKYGSNRGTFDADSPNILFSRARSTVTGQPLPNTWQAPEPTKLDDVIYSLQDKHVDTKRVLQAIRRQVGAIADAQDPYLQEELYHGRAAMATKEFLEKDLRPLLADLNGRGIALSDFEEYLHNRHAQRRNEQVARVNPAMPDGGSGILTADARAYLAGLPADRRRAFEALARRVERINRDTRALLVASGLEKQATIDAWEAAYGDEYVPLMREEMDEGRTGIGQGYSVRGSASKRAMGSDKPVADILANIALQREKAITRAEKRRIGEAVYGLALKAPNPDFWLPIDPALQQDPAQLLATSVQLISLGIDPADAQAIAREPTQRYVGPDGQVHQRINPALRGNDNVLAVRIDGEDKFIFFNARDPRAMRMVSALKNLDADQLGTVMGTVARMTRYFAAINTQYNPIFGVTNITRDVQTALLNLASTPLKDHKADVIKHVLPALRGIYADLRAHRAGRQPTSQFAQLFEEFQREGGATGYRDMFANAQERAEAIADELAAIHAGTARRLGRGIMGWLSDYNEAMENAVRVATYKVGKEQGLSNQQAASIAKNLTVNFNRKGQVALQAGALYAFFNASVQGTARIAQTLFADGKLTAAGQKIIAGGLLLGSMQALLLAAAGFDDEEPPDFVRERALVFPVGGDKYVSIPMPLGFHILPNLGRIPTEWVMGGFRNTPKRIAQMVGLFADAFNPMGSAGLSLQTLTPTIIDPLAALSENRDWTGKPIARKDFDSMHPTAGHTRAKDVASPWARLLSWGLNALTGGTEFKPGLVSPTPDQIDYLIGQVTGGVGREISKASQVASGTLSGEEVPLHKIPLVGRFVGTTTGQAAEASRFYNNLREIGAHKVELDGLRRAGRAEEYRAYLADNPEAAMVPLAERMHREVAAMQKMRRQFVREDRPKESVQALDERIAGMMRVFNARVRKMEQPA